MGAPIRHTKTSLRESGVIIAGGKRASGGVSHLEMAMARQLNILRIPHVQQFKFDVDDIHPDGRIKRKKKGYKADFRIVGHWLLVECEGLVFGPNKKGAHNTATGVRRDIAKYNRAAMLGYHVLRCTNSKGDDETSVANVAVQVLEVVKSQRWLVL